MRRLIASPTLAVASNAVSRQRQLLSATSLPLLRTLPARGQALIPSLALVAAPPRRCCRGLWTEAQRGRLLVLGTDPEAVQDPAARVAAVELPPQAALVLEAARDLASLEREVEDLRSQGAAEADPELRELYDEEVAAGEARLTACGWRLEEELLATCALLPQGVGGGEEEDDARESVLEIAAGVGGQEACFFANELWDMYERFAESRGWSFEVEQFQEGAAGGLISASARVGGAPDAEGAGPQGWLRSESGVHRVQRVPTTDRKGKMQTSSAVVVVLPVAGEADVTMPANEVRIEVSKKSSGPGGQSVNAAHQAIRATHIPTGLTVHCTSSSSQFENRTRAVEMLRTKLLARQIDARAEFERSERRQQRGTGDRSEKIRTYNFSRDDVVDHILGKDGTLPGATAVLSGEGLEAVLSAHRAARRRAALEDGLVALEEKLLPPKARAGNGRR
eukprot:TRINITY_DN21282_c0_g2_i1.p1 TRINITY_DN21282_c0_g2~~TRINITY_DN21282_c0_g2_i1.p1  ORF type:complete len:487 (+),score=128.54 TRINITY_DN21282_c0_g2_i1:109-1461(+)